MGSDASAFPGPRVSPLALRFISAFVGIPLLVAIALIGGVPYLLLVAGAAAVSMGEMNAMLEQASYRPVGPLGMALAALLVLTASGTWPNAAPALLALGAMAGLVWLFGRVDEPSALVDWALTVASVLYVGGLLRFAVPLRDTPDGFGLVWVIVTLVATWASDITAYFVGRAWGRRRLAPRISPGKSVEGAVAGLVAAGLFAPIAPLLLGLLVDGLEGFGIPMPSAIAPASVPRLVGLGLVVGICAPLGDLLESFIKRQCGAKDSGALIPGHGGLLDRIDSLMLAVAGAYLYVVATG